MVFRDTKFHAKIIKLMFLIFHWGHDVSVSLLGYVKAVSNDEKTKTEYSTMMPGGLIKENLTEP